MYLEGEREKLAMPAMAELSLHGREVGSIFDLLGTDENDITKAIAFTLARSPSLLRMFLSKVLNVSWTRSVGNLQIRLQQSETAGGITDIEIEEQGHLYIIIEAKRGWNLPSRDQLKKYVGRKSFKNSTAPFKQLFVLSECSLEYAELNLEPRQLAGLRVKLLSYRDMVVFARSALHEGSHAEKRLIGELLAYLRGVTTMQEVDSNWVYVVALKQEVPKGWAISWIDIVKRKRRYFHPLGVRGFPKEPPNYIAFRHHGRLQSIHHVDEYEVITDPHMRIAEIPSLEWEPHFFYRLGPAFAPSGEVKTGKIWPNGRVWCMLDTLFTCDSISSARDLSQERGNVEG